MGERANPRLVFVVFQMLFKCRETSLYSGMKGGGGNISQEI